MRRPLKVSLTLFMLVLSCAVPGVSFAAPETTVCDSNELSFGATQPIQLTRAKRGGTDPRLEVALTLPSGPATLDLELNRSLLAEDFVAHTEAGTVLFSQQAAPPCLFIGPVKRAGDVIGTAAVSDCAGSAKPLTGVIRIGGATYWLEAENGAQVLRAQGDESAAPTKPFVTQALGATQYVEAVVVNDQARVARKRLVDDVALETLEIINLVDGLYAATTDFDPPIRIRMVSQVSFTQSDPYSPAPFGTTEVDAQDLIDKFTSWSISPTSGLHPADNAILLTGYNLSGSTIGIAWVGGMCWSGYSANVSEARSSSLAFIASVVAHELGHNFNAPHDGEPRAAACPPSGFIMAASTSGRAATDFSSCSTSLINNYFTTADLSCLSNQVLFAQTCGNGIVEAGEGCDCGLEDCSLVDPCCNGTSCQLVSGATCSGLQGCCNVSTCQPHTAGTTCRDSLGSCDAEEVCDGASAECPSDRLHVDGEACVTRDFFSGQCFDGVCSSRDAHCASFNESLGLPLESCSSPTNCATTLCQEVGVPSTCMPIPERGFLIAQPRGAECTTSGVSGYCSQGSCEPLTAPSTQCAELNCGNGTCVLSADNTQLQCVCNPGWTGAGCERNINECIQNPCVNGSCTDEAGSFRCSCDSGWTGALCDQNIDDCAPNPCFNGGTCSDGVARFTCACPVGFSGRLCEILPLSPATPVVTLPPGTPTVIPSTPSPDLAALAARLASIEAAYKTARRPLRGSKRRVRKVRKARREVKSGLSELAEAFSLLPATLVSARPSLTEETAILAKKEFSKTLRKRLNRRKKRRAVKNFNGLLQQLRVGLT